MDFQEALEYIESCTPKEMVLGLDRIKNLLVRLGSPEKKMKFIHIAGTNGKGSAGAYLANILVCAGYKVGRYISPTILEYCERIQILENETCRYISKEAVSKKTEQIREVINSMQQEGLSVPTGFEIETAMAFLEYVEQKCDYVILEVGLGGKEDATNVIEKAELALLTSISKDHMGMLGNSIEEITLQKAGIIKHGSDVVCYDFDALIEGDKIQQVVKKTCDSMQAKYRKADFRKLTGESFTLEGTKFAYEGVPYEIHLLGENQPKNAVLALEAAKCLKEKGLSITLEAMQRGLKTTEWKGRFSIVAENPLLIVDGAHNEDAARSLAKTIELYFPKKKCIFIVGIFADKEYEKILALTSPYAKKILTIQSDNPRAMPSCQLAEIAGRYVEDVVDAKTIDQALDMVKSWKEEVVLAFGSLSFLGEIYSYYQKKSD